MRREAAPRDCRRAGDLPQVVDVVANPRGTEFLLRDCENMCAWFAARGLDADPQELFGELVGFVY